MKRKETGYIDYISGRYEVFLWAEGRRWRVGHRSTLDKAESMCRKYKLNPVYIK